MSNLIDYLYGKTREFAGSIQVNLNALIKGKLQVDDTTEATTTTDGSVATAGGGSFAKNVVVGGANQIHKTSVQTTSVALESNNVADSGTFDVNIHALFGKSPATKVYSIIINAINIFDQAFNQFSSYQWHVAYNTASGTEYGAVTLVSNANSSIPRSMSCEYLSDGNLRFTNTSGVTTNMKISITGVMTG